MKTVKTIDDLIREKDLSAEELDKMSRTAEELWQEAQRLSLRVNGIYLHVAPVPMRKVYH